LIQRIFDAYARAIEEMANVLSAAERVQLVNGLRKLGKRAAVSGKAY
jgi:hypothetical protein